MVVGRRTFLMKISFLSIAAVIALAPLTQFVIADEIVSNQRSTAKTEEGERISWREHIVDDSLKGQLSISGSDGLSAADIDNDGFLDFVSVHESDTTYHGQPIGHVRIAWGTEDPDRWELTTLATGVEAAAAEDVAIADANGDGYVDIVVACELAHLIYFQNPGKSIRTSYWNRIIPPITQHRGSYIRVFFADLNLDGKPEVVASNKGDQNPDISTTSLNNISFFVLPDNPLDGLLWREQLLGKVRIPINSQPFDLDGDGDLDVVGGSRGEARIMWFENKGNFQFKERKIVTKPPQPRYTGFNMDFSDLDGDGLVDIVTNGSQGSLLMLSRVEREGPWRLRVLGNTEPDMLVSIRLADIDGDADLDIFTGTYSLGPRDRDGSDIDRNSSIGRISWFENRGSDQVWICHDISRRKRGMYDKWLAYDLDRDGDMDFIGTRGNSDPYDGVIWLEQLRGDAWPNVFTPARMVDSEEMPLPNRVPN